jgi:O-antigen/teichoic acid export membrane protein
MPDAPARPPATAFPAPADVGLSAAALAAEEGRFDLRGEGLRRHTARGTLINAVYLVGVSSLGLVRGFFVAAYLTASDYGIWGILVVGMGTLAWLKEVGIGDKYVQQAEEDQELAFQKAFTLELIFSGLFFAALLLTIPALALVYDQPKLIAPGLVLSLVVPAAALQIAIAVFYRRMEFVRQRLLQSWDPLVGFVVTIALAVAGAGYWSLVIGTLAGAWAAAIAAWQACPYPLRLRYDRGTARRYVLFSWPLFVASVSGVVTAQAAILVGNATLGLAGVGAIALAATISQFAQRVDLIVTGTLYPAICAVRDRIELLAESFVKSNRLALMWGMPFGLGVALFAPDLITYGIGERWRSAEVLIQVFGLAAAFNQIGFNWDAYFRALGRTRPVAVVNGVSTAAFLAVAIPFLISDGLDGFAIGMAIVTVVTIAARAWFLRRLFEGFDMARHIARAVLPSIPPVLLVLAVRRAGTFDRTLAVVLGELALYLAVTAATTYLFERSLLRETMSYLRRRPAGGVPATT